MPRRSAASLAVLPAVTGMPSRLSPPAHLGERERTIFLDIVSDSPATHFLPSDTPLLCRYCECAALAERAAAALAEPVVGGEVRPGFPCMASKSRR